MRPRMGEAMGEPRREGTGSGRPEIYWILFVLVSAGVYLAVVEPARREAASARGRLARARAKLAARLERISHMRRDRKALQGNDRQAWEAAARGEGMGAPGEFQVPEPPPEIRRHSQER